MHDDGRVRRAVLVGTRVHRVHKRPEVHRVPRVRLAGGPLGRGPRHAVRLRGKGNQWRIRFGERGCRVVHLGILTRRSDTVRGEPVAR